MELILFWIAVGVVTGLAASARGRSFWGWLVLGCLFSFFALIAVLVMDRVEQQATFHRPSGPTAMDRLEAAQGVHSLGQLAQERESRRAGSISIPHEPDGFVETFGQFDLFRRNGRVWVRDREFPTLEAARAFAMARTRGEREPEVYRNHAIVPTDDGLVALDRSFATANEARAAIDEKLRPVD